ncbi:activating signal cointegrator 1 complex subunit 1-like [Contarinia nasturtii]|uniref:activating signal cointegrator 1 complex subunit 1-like n=1 Tax=Contarinia nasturtii TaxID=265458 RepID=UPI0012D3FEFC|nr:activating signal cointegrator 1 complex subunit 1-like [Contarinia nasturtii]
MDILQPQLLWIGKRCYRINSVAKETEYEHQQPTRNEYIEDDLYGDEDAIVQDDDIDVIKVSANDYKFTFHVPQAFYGAIIGNKGSVKKRIEGDTRTEIIIPKHSNNNNKHGSLNTISILGKKRESVCLAFRRIGLILINCRNKQRPTHFTCVRVVEQNIKHRFIAFKDDILKSGSTVGLQEEMFTQPDKLHITISVLVLMDDQDRRRAVDLLNDCRESIVIPIKNKHGGAISANIRGVEIMNDDESSVRYLYGKIESNALQEIADAILKRFIDAGLGKREFDRDTVKLHMTLINANLTNRDEDGNASAVQKFKAKTFDARHILEKYAQYEFGSQQFNDIYLSIMQTKDVDGFYKCTSTIQF